MWLYAQAWLPLLTITLAAALCFGVASVFNAINATASAWSSAPPSFARMLASLDQ